MSVPLPYQLPSKLSALRAATGQSRKQFAARVAIDASHWSALERGRRQIATRAMLDGLLSRLPATNGDRTDLLHAFDHDRVIAQLALGRFPQATFNLVSRCLQASLLLSAEELLGLLSLVESSLDSKEQLLELARRAPLAKEAAMD